MADRTIEYNTRTAKTYTVIFSEITD